MISNSYNIKEKFLESIKANSQEKGKIFFFTPPLYIRARESILQPIEIPSELFALQHLETLAIGGVPLAPIPKEIIKLINLKVLTFSECELTVFPDIICQLTQLQELGLSSNKIKEIPSCIFKLINLESLSFRGCELTVFPDIICQLTQLQVLDLSSNKIKEVPPCISELTQLHHLNIHNNQLISLPDNVLSKLAQLKKLSIGCNQLKKLPSDIMQVAKNIQQHLDMVRSKISLEDVRNEVFDSFGVKIEKDADFLIDNSIEKTKTALFNINLSIGIDLQANPIPIPEDTIYSADPVELIEEYQRAILNL